jgi:hypothetical protein
VVTPPPNWFTEPVPETTPPNVTASERLKARVPLSVTSPAMEPVVPPVPSCKVPAVIIVPPL